MILSGFAETVRRTRPVFCVTIVFKDLIMRIMMFTSIILKWAVVGKFSFFLIEFYCEKKYDVLNFFDNFFFVEM